MKTIARLLLACALPLLSSCSDISGGPFEGRVFEEGTRKPLEGATVVVKWFAAMSGMNGPWYPCYHVEVATTGKDGRFLVPKWTISEDDPGAPTLLKDLNLYRISSIDKPIETQVYMPEYVAEEMRWTKQATAAISARPFKGTDSERVEMLYRLDRRIDECPSSEHILSLRKRLLAEARSIARSSVDAFYVEGLLTGIETTEHGPDEARRRGQIRDVQRSKGQL